MRNFTILLISFLFGSLTYAQDSNPEFNWVETEINPGHNIKGFCASDSINATVSGFARTLKTTSDGGNTWSDVNIFTNLYNFLDISIKGDVGYSVSNRSKAVDNPSKGEDDIYASGVLLKTIDGGQTWTNLSLEGLGEGDDPMYNPNLPGAFNIDFLSVESLSNDVALVGVRWVYIENGSTTNYSCAFKSKDGGNTWKAIPESSNSSVVSCFNAIGDDFFIGGNKMLLKGSINNDTIINIYDSIDADGSKGAYIADLDVINNELIVTSTSDSIYISKDAGASFSTVPGLKGANDFYKYNNDVMIALGSSSKSQATIDGGVTWNNCYPGTSIWDIGGILNDSLMVLAKSNIYKIAISDLVSGSYDSWKAQEVHNGFNLHKVYLKDENSAILVGYGECVVETNDKGLSWTPLSMPELRLENEVDFDFNTLSQGSDGAQYASTRRLKMADYPSSSDKEDLYYSGLIVKTSDNWATWDMIDNTKIGAATPDDASSNPTMEGCFGIDHYSMECVDENTAYVYTNWYDTINSDRVTHSRVFKTIDGGENWNVITDDFGSNFITEITFNADTGFIVGRNVLLRTTDGGINFTDLYPALAENTDGDLYINSIELVNKIEWYIVTSSDGTFATKDGGQTYSKIKDISGANDMAVFDDNSFMVFGSSTKTKYTNKGGDYWFNCYPGSTIWSQQGIWNDSLVVLSKGSIFKLAVSGLNTTFEYDAVETVPANSQLKLAYMADGLEVLAEQNIKAFTLYSSTGQQISKQNHSGRTLFIANGTYQNGVYILVVKSDAYTERHKIILR